ncbi:MAG: DUF3857 domain-containing protein [Marinoscillum sp.]|uniref:DUF3857 domain-containing protein n=3 Tax=Marinoscillum sp. TaxID=2024838 RepID=UPI0032F2E568
MEYNIDLQIDKQSLIETKSFLIKIGNKESNWLGDVSIHHQATDKFRLLEAVLLDHRLNVVRKIKAKDVYTKNADSRSTFFDDHLEDKFSLRHNQFPYYIKYSYRIIKRDFLFLAYWIPQYYSNVSTISSSLSLTRPMDYEIHLDSIGEFTYSSTRAAGLITEKWSIKQPKKIGKADFSPPATESLQQISIVPSDINYGVKGSHASWEDFGEWVANLNSGLDLLPEEEIATLKKKFGHIEDQDTLIKKLYHHLQDNTRYINVSLDIGGMKPHPAEYVLINKYGDCKALTIYMKALLNAFGIPSFYTLVESGSNPKSIRENFPSQQFDHVILCVPTKSDTIWLENTVSYLPYNYLGSFTQNRKALLVNKGGSQLVKTPALTHTDVHQTNTYHLTFEGDRLTGTLYSKLKGEDYEKIAYVETNLSSQEKKKYCHKYFNNQGFELIDLTIHQNSRSLPEVELTAQIDLPKHLRQVGPLRIISLPASTMPASEVFKDRTRPVRLMMPIDAHDKVIIDSSQNWTWKLPENFSLISEFGTYQITYELVNNSPVINRRISLGSRDIPIENTAELYTFLLEIETYESSAPIIPTH